MLTSIFFSPTAHCQAVQAENVTVLEGGTAQISCRLQNYDGSIVVIQNPRRQTLFFNGTRGVFRVYLQKTRVYTLNCFFFFFFSVLFCFTSDVLTLPLKCFHIARYNYRRLNFWKCVYSLPLTAGALSVLKAWFEALCVIQC